MALEDQRIILSHDRSLENYLLVWLDPSSTHYDATLSLFQNLLHSIHHCSNLAEFQRLVVSLIDVKIIVILTDPSDDATLSHLDTIDAVYSIYLLSNEERKAQKLQGIFHEIQPLYDFIRRDLRQINQDFYPLHVLPSDPNHAVYRSTMLLRDILLHRPPTDQLRRRFLDFVRQAYLNDAVQTALIDEYARSADNPNVAIHWFTRDCFLSALLRRALNIKDYDLLDRLAFFITDLHRQIETVHHQSLTDQKLTVYYGQGMSEEQFEKLRSHPDGLMVVETFLMAAIDREVSLVHAEQSAERVHTVPVLFEIEIDRNNSSFPFVRLDSFDFYQDTDHYVLFSLGATFRIGTIQWIDQQVWQVTLTFIDPLKTSITEKSTEFQSLAKLMVQTEHFSEGKKIYQMVLEQTSTDDHRRLGQLYQELGFINQKLKQYPEALEHYQKSLAIRLASLPKTDRLLAPSFYAVAQMLCRLGKLNEAVTHFQSAIEYGQKSSLFDKDMLATFYMDLGSTFQKLGHSSQAKTALESALQWGQKSRTISSGKLKKIQSRLQTLTE